MKRLATRLGADLDLLICEEDADLLAWRSVLEELSGAGAFAGLSEPPCVEGDSVVMDAASAEVLYERLMHRRDKKTRHIRSVLRRLAHSGHAYKVLV